MKTIALFILTFLFAAYLQAQKVYSEMSAAEKKLYNEHIIKGQPDRSNGPVYVRHGYIMKYHEKYRIPEWVAYHIIPDYLNTPDRERKFKSFRTDPDMDNPVIDDYYTGTGYARGHMAPYFAMGGDRNKNGKYAELFDDSSDPYDEQTVFEANYMSNIAPQDQNAMNGAGGPWYALETKIRDKFVGENKMALNVVVGGIVDSSEQIRTMKGSYGDAGIAVPDWFFQVLIYKSKEGEYFTAGFLFRHVKDKNDLPYDELIDYLVPVDSLETLTGFDFLNKLTKSLQSKTESKDNKEFWVSKGL